MNTPPPDMKLDHYRDAIAICRATLANDQAGLLAIFQSCNAAMTFQALVRLHLESLLARTDHDPDIVDRFLADFLTHAAGMEDQ